MTTGLHVEVRYNKYQKYYEVWLVNGVQSFQFRYTGTRRDCVWFREMLKKAGVPR